MSDKNDKNEKSLLGKIGNIASALFLVEVPDITTTPEDTTTQNKSIKPNPENTQPNVNTQTNIVNTVLNSANITETDSRFEAQIRQAIREADQPGPDYLEFSESVKNLQANGLNIDDAIQNSYLVLKGMGLTKEIIIKSAEHYLSILINESKNFEDAILNGNRERVEIPQKEVETIMDDNANIQRQLKVLQDKIDYNNQQIAQKNQDITQAQTKLEINKRKFQNTINFIKSEIESTLSKIKNKML